MHIADKQDEKTALFSPSKKTARAGYTISQCYHLVKYS